MKELSTVEFLSQLRKLDVNLSVDGERFRINAPAGVITPEIQKELTARKADILRFLKEALQSTRSLPPPMSRVSRDRELPLSFAQMRLWLLDQLTPGSSTYIVQSCFRLKGKLDLAVFEQSLNEIVRRHEALRTCFLTVDGRAVQKVCPAEPCHLSAVDLQGLPDAGRDDAVLRAWANATRPFDLGQAPLIRATVLKLAAQEHVLLISTHHIAFDEWSFGVFETELSTLYKSYLAGNASPLPELQIQYADFAAWQREWLQGEALETQLAYWREKLAGNLPVLELPTDRPRPVVQTNNGSTFSLLLSRDLTDALKALSRREGVTLFITLLTAFEVLLMSYSGQEDLLVGTPIANRNRPEIEGLIGFFVNTLVMRSDLSGNPSFRELLGRVHETALGAYAHQDLPFEKLVQELNPERDLSRSPILQVLFSFLNTPAQPLDLPGVEAIRMTPDSGTSKFDLSLYAIETSEGISCNFEYNTDLFDAVRIERMSRHMQILLEGIVRGPGQALSKLEILPAEERRQILVDWNRTQIDYPDSMTLHQLFEAQVLRTPEAVAVEFENCQVSYRELNDRANQLARHLKALGVAPDVLVGVFCERSQDMLVALLGILKAGGAYVPLDPSFPEDRLNYMVRSSGMSVMITHSALDGRLPARPASVVRMDMDWKEIAKREPSGLKGPVANPSNLAYVLYTSGSTGNPKGVEIEHSAIVNLLASMQREPGFTSRDTMLAVTTLSFDIAGLELFLPLIAGGRVVIASREDTHDPSRLMRRMEESRCTVMQATPTTWRALIGAGWAGSPNLKILCGGEAISADLAEKLEGRCGELWNMYGPTETTVWSTVWKISSTNGAVPIGRPIANTDLFILDGNCNPVPAGVVGELYIGGAGLARGYLHQPELTKERFVKSPFAEKARLYRTGDLARWLPEGIVECLGRVDHQVKIRGFRIELEEIEAILGRHPGVRQCVVVAREDGSGDKKLVAYCESRGETQPAIGDLRDDLKKKLPDYMVPTAWVFLPALPLTPNGKVDRKALPLPEQQQSRLSINYVAPLTETEKTVARIWEEVLGARAVGIHEDFFELGGHSMIAVNFIGEIERVFGIRLPLISLFHAPTIAQFSEIIFKEQCSRGKSRAPTDPEILAQRVRQFIVENYLDGWANGLKNSDSFLEHQIIDPMRLNELVDFMEETFGVTVGNDALTGSNLDSIDNVARFLQHSLNGEMRAEPRAVAEHMAGENQ